MLKDASFSHNTYVTDDRRRQTDATLQYKLDRTNGRASATVLRLSVVCL